MRISSRPSRLRPGPIIGLVLIGVALLVGWRLLGARASPTDAADGAPATPVGMDAMPSDDPQAAGAGQVADRRRDAPVAERDGEDPTPDLSDYVLPGETPTMKQVIDELHRRGIRTGLGAFQPPGTSPPLEGLEVPADFELPEGYVRHHQATDDGQAIAPILMFAPDFQPVDAQGRPIPVPADRVVPPELAPPGMPRRPVRIPPPRDGGTGP